MVHCRLQAPPRISSPDKFPDMCALMPAIGATQLNVLTGETRLKHVNTSISSFFSVRVFRRQLIGSGTDAAVPTPEANLFIDV